MRKMAYLFMALIMVSTCVVNADYITHNFDSLTAGTNFIIDIDGWQSINTDVVVTTDKSVSGDKSIFLPSGTAISNSVSQTPVAKAWTQFYIIPMLGDKPFSSVASSNSTCSLYFDAEGKVEVWTNSNWSTCNSNVWGSALTALNGTNWVNIAIYQNFSTHKAVVFVDGIVALQDIPFSDASENDYNFFVADNVDSNAYLDDVRVQEGYDQSRLTEDVNGINGYDAEEVDVHGYVGRTLYVGAGGPAILTFADLQAAVDEARNLDRIHVASTETMSEDITFQNDDSENNTYYIIGDAFTNAGTFTVASGATLHIEQFVDISTNIVTGTMSLSNDLVTADLTVTGTLSGNSITATDASVDGAVTIASGGTFDVNDLDMANGGTIDVTSGTLAEADNSVNLTGTFVLNDVDWNASGSTTASLTFTEDFENFSNGMELNSMNAQLVGWGANSNNVIAQSSVTHGGSLAAIIPAGGILSNRISTSEQKIWTEYYIQPAHGVGPNSPDTNSMIFLSYVTENGYMAVPNTDGSWQVFTNDMATSGALETKLASNVFTRVDIFTDFTGNTNKYALFIDGRIVAEQRTFVGGLSHATYENFSIISEDNVAYIDDVLITASIPPSMTEDVNNSGIPDAFNIHNYGTIFPPANGSLFKFK